tara:strand:- start:194 stop:340 length:147 start_codon:yes stop_codon:yes gene_type:complete
MLPRLNGSNIIFNLWSKQKPMKHIQLKAIQLKNHQEVNERWLENIITV